MRAAGTALAALLVQGPISALPAWADEPPGSAAVRRILREVPLVDGHNDLPWRLREKVAGCLDSLDVHVTTTADSLHTDLARLRAGGVGAQFWSVYVPADLPGAEAVAAVLEQIDLVHRMVQRYPEYLELALTVGDIRRIHGRGRIASLIGVEGGHCIHNSLDVLRQLHALGARYMTLTHNLNTEWADSATDEPKNGGLTPFGGAVVREMNRLGMLVDLSHVSHATMHAALDACAAPVIFSHSSAAALTEHVRNVPDDVLRRLPQNGGVVMVTFVPRFVSSEVFADHMEEEAERARLGARYPGQKKKVEELLQEWRKRHPQPRATLARVADHIAHVARVSGVDHVGLGSDFDGMREPPLGLEDVSCFPNLLAELLQRGFSEQDVKKIAGLNLLRVMREAERVAARLQREGGPAELRWDEAATRPQSR